MQQLSKRNTYTPPDTSHVGSNCDHILNIPVDRESEYDLKTFDNTSEVNHSQHRGNRNPRVFDIVYVLNMKGKPLMPTTQQKANKLLKKGEVKVVRRFPFTLQMKRATGENRQDINLGVDIGYKNVGLSAGTKKKELYSVEVNLRTDIIKLNSERRMYRKDKRNKKHWYRPARFLNRKKDSAWLAPSIRHKIDSHLRIVDKVHKLLPISRIVVEIAKFDIQKIKNPEIRGEEYQQGPQLEYQNVREYVLHRDGHKCRNCGQGDRKFHVHHLESRMNGGDRPDNLITLCDKCHQEYHQGKIKLKTKKSKGYKEVTCMNMIRMRIVNGLKKLFSNVEITYGYITKYMRKVNNIEKSHVNDAFIISGGSNQKRCHEYQIQQRRRNNRCLQICRKGYKPAIRRKRYSLQPMSLVLYMNKIFRCSGTQSYGREVKLKDIKKDILISAKKVKLIKYSEGFNYA
jgi:N6-L-threonylcarbamoyladenine synthase